MDTQTFTLVLSRITQLCLYAAQSTSQFAHYFGPMHGVNRISIFYFGPVILIRSHTLIKMRRCLGYANVIFLHWKRIWATFYPDPGLTQLNPRIAASIIYVVISLDFTVAVVQDSKWVVRVFYRISSITARSLVPTTTLAGSTKTDAARPLQYITIRYRKRTYIYLSMI